MKNMIQLAWLSILGGIWLIIAPFMLTYADRRATTNDIVIGVIIIIIGLATLSGERWAEGKNHKNEE